MSDSKTRESATERHARSAANRSNTSSRARRRFAACRLLQWWRADVSVKQSQCAVRAREVVSSARFTPSFEVPAAKRVTPCAAASLLSKGCLPTVGLPRPQQRSGIAPYESVCQSSRKPAESGKPRGNLIKLRNGPTSEPASRAASESDGRGEKRHAVRTFRTAWQRTRATTALIT